MKLTKRQKYLLTNLHQIIKRKKAGGGTGYFLAKDDCTITIHSLIVKGVLVKEEDRTVRLAQATPDHYGIDAR